MLSSAQENLGFWFLWLATLVVIVHQLFKSASSQEGILGFVPPFCMMFAYFYIVQAAIVATSLSDRISPEYLVLGQLAVLLSLIGGLWGWYRGSAGSIRVDPREKSEDNPQTLWYLSLGAIFVGLVGQYTFFSMGFFQQGVLSSQDVSGYWYMLFHVAYPGIAIGVALISRRAEFRTGGPALLLILCSFLLMYPWIIAARRGPLFPFVVVVIYSYYLMRPKVVNRAVVIGSLGAAGVAMLLLFAIRDYTTSGLVKFNEERLRQATAMDIITGKAYEESDNEYLYHCVYVGSVLETDRYQWGTGYLSLMTHWIPRSWWPDKPALAQGWFDPLTKEEMFNITGVYVTSGAASGGVAETFVNLAWFAPMFWFAIGWVMGRAYLFGRRHPNRVGPMIYVGMLAGMHWLISQGFGAAFVPIAIYVIVPILIYAVAGKGRAVSTKAPRSGIQPRMANRMAMRVTP